jgi:ferredoxin-NADP reductase
MPENQMNAAANKPAFVAKLKARRVAAERTVSFYFERPSGWNFKAGQYLEISLFNPAETDSEGKTRAFSIASAPHETDLMITTRMRDTAFKRVLNSLPLGSEVGIEGPFGDFTLHHNVARPAILLAGGIGITPFRGMVVHAGHEKLAQRIFLLYSNRRPEDAPFLDELEALRIENGNYRFIPTMTQIADSHRPWHGETDMIGMHMLSKFLKTGQLPNIYMAGPIYYVAGPPAMVSGLRATLEKAGVDSDDIRAEEFAGY